MADTEHKIRDTVLEKFVGWALDALVDLVKPIAIAALIGVCIVVWGWFSQGAIAPWLFAAVCALLLMAVVATLVLWRRVWVLTHRPVEKRFTPIPVEDPVLPIGWSITKDPPMWVDQRLTDVSSEYMAELLDGPFHLAEGCHERLAVARPNSTAEYELQESCPGCKERVFTRTPERPKVTWVRRLAVYEIQRMARLGQSITPPRVILARPRYHSLLAAPAVER